MAMSLGVAVAAKESGLSERTIRAAISSGALKVLRVGRRVLVEPAALTAYLKGKPAESQRGAR